VADADGRLVGLLELDYRKYAPGGASSPVAFIEGWYVEPAMQGPGVGRALVDAAENYAGAAGHDEVASDVYCGSDDAIRAHRALGYREVGRVVCFRKPIGRAPSPPASVRPLQRGGNKGLASLWCAAHPTRSGDTPALERAATVASDMQTV
jgi:GNAT superfamily N-acetyltransferase